MLFWLPDASKVFWNPSVTICSEYLELRLASILNLLPHTLNICEYPAERFRSGNATLFCTVKGVFPKILLERIYFLKSE